jgi:hypothetical protein
MSENAIPQQILVITGPPLTDQRDREPRRGLGISRLPNLQSVDITNLQEQVNVFLQQLDRVMSETPEKVGGFHLAEFEVSAGIVVEAKGGVQLALLANAEAGGGINAGLKFVFKR